MAMPRRTPRDYPAVEPLGHRDLFQARVMRKQDIECGSGVARMCILCVDVYI